MLLTPFLLASVAAPQPAADITPTVPVAVEGEGFFSNWHGSWNVGLNYSDGNTDLRSASVAFDAERREGDNRYTVGGYWNNSKQRSTSSGEFETIQRNAGGQIKYDRFLNEKAYVWADATAMTDELANLDLRWTAGGGFGYQFIDMGVDADDNKITKAGEIDNLRGELGLTFVSEEFNPVGGVTEENEYLAARAMVDFGMDITETVRIENTSTIFPSLEDSDDFYGNAVTRVMASLTETMFASITWTYLYDNTPATGAERSDNRVVAGLGWTF